MLGAMPRHPYVPSELTHGPFTIADAARARLDRWHLEASCWKRLGPETYVWRQLPETPCIESRRPCAGFLLAPRSQASPLLGCTDSTSSLATRSRPPLLQTRECRVAPAWRCAVRSSARKTSCTFAACPPPRSCAR